MYFYGRNETTVYVEYEENEIPEPQYADESYDSLISGWHDDWAYPSENVVYGEKK